MSKKYLSMDGNTAAAHVAYAFSEVASIYPITPSSPMAEHAEEWASQGRKNIFGSAVNVVEMQSEAGAAGAVHGALQGGALATTFTASQGLLLMIPNLYKIQGEMLPGVFHVAARALATSSLNIFGDHQDVYACRQTGIPMLCSHSVQEVMDLAGVAHLTAIKAGVPFIHFFDGFRTSHEIQKVEVLDYETLASLVDHDAIKKFKANALNPHTNPVERGGADNDDIYFQSREAQNKHYDAVVEIAADYMKKISEITGREYAPFTYYGDPEADRVIIAMGSVTETIKDTIDEMAKEGEKVGVIKVHLYRPFSPKYLKAVLPATAKKIAVLDRTKEMGATGEPLYLDVCSVIRDADTLVIGGRYGMGSKDTTPQHIKAVYDHLNSDNPFTGFTIGIKDDVTHLSLPDVHGFHINSGVTQCLFYGLGSDGTVSANKSSIKIIGDNTDLYCQAYFAYDSKKAGGATRSNLRFGNKPIRATYYVNRADFISCSLDNYCLKYDMLKNLKDGGRFLLNTEFTKEEIADYLPNRVKKQLADKHAKFYIINANKIAGEIGMGRRTNTILQSAFFALNEQILPIEEAVTKMKEMAKKSYSNKGENIVQANYKAIDAGKDAIEEVTVDPEWSNLTVLPLRKPTGDDYFDNFVAPINALEGYDLPTSAFLDKLDGTMQNGVAIKEKRAIAIQVPKWEKDNCIQCNRCAYVCPHAAIRPVAMTEAEAAEAPVALDMTGMKEYKFAIAVSALDCTGCGSCANVCPGKKGAKALAMENMEANVESQKFFDYAVTLPEKEDVIAKFKENTVKGSQFKQPLLEFSGACAGCGETPYAKLITQLFGERMYIANATGCSSIWGGSAPATPYTTNAKGQGPAWANSLFEDNAEFGLGMFTGQNTLREQTKEKVVALAESTDNADVKAAAAEYLDTYADGSKNGAATDKLVAALDGCDCDTCKDIVKNKDFLAKKSQWIFGGDGWAYDIGFGGVDHVLASGKDINVMVFDTEVYSNTGGQASKSTNLGAIAQFQAAGKGTKKKDLAAIAMSYGYVYVAQIAMGADYNQTVKAIAEAEAYPGPSLVIGYAPCINHGIKGGMKIAQTEEKKAVTSGYWNLFRFNPALAAEGKNPFHLDSKAPTTEYEDFIMGEVRYNALSRQNPERAKELFAEAKANAEAKYNRLKEMSDK